MRCSVLAVVSTILFAAPALAHDLNFECTVQGDKLTVKAYFTDGARAAASNVKLIDANGKVLQSGVADDDGRWTCPRPPEGVYRVVVDAGQGHRKQHQVTVPRDAEGTITDGPDEAEFTAFPWLKLGIGLAFFLALGLGAWLANRKKVTPEALDG